MCSKNRQSGFFFSSKRRHTRCALVTGVQTCALPILSQVKHLLQGKGNAIYSIAPDAPVLDAIKHMAEHRIGALLVMRGEQLVSVISERDYARKVILQAIGRASCRETVCQSV